MLKALVAVALALAWEAMAEPNPDIEAYCRSTSQSFVAMQTCIEAERKVRNERSCLDALASWPKDKPCPPVWFQTAVENLRLGRPCLMTEVTQ